MTPKAARPQDGRQDGAHNENRGRLSSGQRLSVLALVIAGGHVAFVTLMVPPLDERFLLTAAPALMLAGVLGWTRSPHRAAAGAAAIVGFLAVAVDFHTGDASALDPQTTIMMDEPSAGFGLRGSWERRGWGPAGRSRPSPHPLREDVWAAVGAVHAKRVGVIGAPLFDPFGDRWWWRYRARLGEVDGTWKRQGELKVVHLCKGGDPPDVDVIIASDARVQPIDRPWCPAAGDWAPGRRIAAPPPTVGAVVWYPRGVKPGRPTAD